MIKILGIRLGARTPEQEAADALLEAKLALGPAKLAKEHYEHHIRMLEQRIARLSPEVARDILRQEQRERDRAALRRSPLAGLSRLIRGA